MSAGGRQVMQLDSEGAIRRKHEQYVNSWRSVGERDEIMRLNAMAGLAAAAIAAGSLAATEARALVVDFGYTGAAQSWTAPAGVFSPSRPPPERR